MRHINVLGFTGCGMACDCGARVVLGATRTDMQALYWALHRAGFAFEVVPMEIATTRATGMSAGKLAKYEPFTAGAQSEFLEYVGG